MGLMSLLCAVHVISTLLLASSSSEYILSNHFTSRLYADAAIGSSLGTVCVSDGTIHMTLKLTR